MLATGSTTTTNKQETVVGEVERLQKAAMLARQAGDVEAYQELLRQAQQARAHLERTVRAEDKARQAGDVEAWQAIRNERERLAGESVSASGDSDFRAGIGQGLKDIGIGTMQLGAEAAKAAGFDRPADYWGRRARRSEIQWQAGEPGLEANIGRVAGQVAGALPAGGAVGGLTRGVAQRGLQAAAQRGGALGAAQGAGILGAEGAAIGAAEGALEPVVGEEESKLGHAMRGAAWGGGIGAGARLAGEGIDAVRNARRISAQRARNIGGADEVARANALEARTGVPLSPAQRSGRRWAQAAENVMRQSIYTGDRALNAAKVQAGRLRDYVQKQIDTLAQGAPVQATAEIGKRIQRVTAKARNEMFDRRSKFGEEAFGEIHRAAGGQPVVRPTNALNAIRARLREFEGVSGHEAEKALKGLRKIAERWSEKPMTAQQAMRQMQALNNRRAQWIKGVGPGTDGMIKREVYNALMDDLDQAAGAAGGPVGEMMRRANAGWRQLSEDIDHLDMSILGDVMGQERASGIVDSVYNDVPGEKAFQIFRTAPIESLEVAKDYIQKGDPTLWSQIQAGMLADALEIAERAAPSAGATALAVSPAQLVKRLEGGATEAGRNLAKRMKVVFGDNLEEVQDILELGRRMSDTFGMNTSGTANAAEIHTALRDIASGTAARIQGLAALVGLAGAFGRQFVDPAALQAAARRPAARGGRQATGRSLTVPAAALGAPAAVGNQAYYDDDGELVIPVGGN